MLLIFLSDKLLTLTIDGNALIAHNEIETHSFPVNYFGFSTTVYGGEARFYYNCKSKKNTDVSIFNQPFSDLNSCRRFREKHLFSSVLFLDVVVENALTDIIHKRIVADERLVNCISNKSYVQFIKNNKMGLNQYFLLKHKAKPQCGKRKNVHLPLITRGFGTREGDWPWHSGIWYTIDERRSYACGGSLITAEAVITAAHCLHINHRAVTANQVLVSLGKRNLYLSGPSTQEFFAQRVIVHPDYNQNSYQNDIGIIRLATEAIFTTYVQPICLWDANRVALGEVIGRNGSVVGWGLNEQNQYPQEIGLAYMPVVSLIDCLESDTNFFNALIHDGMFCAGFRNGK